MSALANATEDAETAPALRLRGRTILTTPRPGFKAETRGFVHGPIEKLDSGLFVPVKPDTSKRTVLGVGPEVRDCAAGDTIILNLDHAPSGVLDDGTELWHEAAVLLRVEVIG